MRKLVQIIIPQPCNEKWDEMTPAEKGRFCDSCQKNVIDFTKTSDREIAEALNSNKSLCGRFSTSQLERDLVIPKEKSTVWTAFAAGVLSFVTLGSYKASAQETITTEQTDYNYSYDNVGILTGIVRDKNDVLADVTIINKTKNETTVSLLNGDYEILADKGDIIEFSLTGYKTKTITVTSDSRKNIKLKKDKTHLQESFIITGTVSDDSGLLPDVTVIVKGTQNPIQTDFEGNFSIEVQKGEILQFSHIGYDITEEQVTNNKTLNITMESGLIGLIVIERERSFFGRVFHSIGNIFR